MSLLQNYADWFTGNYILNVAILTFLCSQLVKVIIELLLNKKITLSRIVGSGGMPSSHAATVVALTVCMGKVCGTASPEFALSAIFASIVIYDALNVRRAAGEQAKRINFIMENWHHIDTPEAFERQLKELLGHTPLQVFIGMLLGLAFGLLL